jgi:exopolyphosphatase/guanosine-5'-triphosphate,3'-diphosphate pyrophosphatase
MQRYAAIDIGSNAIRMLFVHVYEKSDGPVFKKLSLVRLPVRLGEDAFINGVISEKKEDHIINMAKSFNHLCSIFEVIEYRATATSAMRDSSNGMTIIQRVLEETNVKIEIIEGEEEAKILYESIFNSGKIETNESYMFIDVGGGSTEINFYVNGERKSWRSFNLGSVRLKEGIQDDSLWNEFDNWIEDRVKVYNPKIAVGTGGNINKIYKLCGHSDWELLHRSEIASIIDYLKGFTSEEMINRFDIKSDRADVIIPGGLIYLRAMEKARISEMIVPKVGLADGLIRRMYLENNAPTDL